MFFYCISLSAKKKPKPNYMDEPELHQFLLEQGIPAKWLPKLIEVPKSKLVPIMEGYAKQNKTKIFYICVCNSGHEATCADFVWDYSGWSFRVKGKKVVFFNRDWVFDISQIPVFQNTLYIVSQRTKLSECAQCRYDLLFVSTYRDKLKRKRKKVEGKRKQAVKKKKSRY